MVVANSVVEYPRNWDGKMEVQCSVCGPLVFDVFASMTPDVFYPGCNVWWRAEGLEGRVYTDEYRWCKEVFDKVQHDVERVYAVLSWI